MGAPDKNTRSPSISKDASSVRVGGSNKDDRSHHQTGPKSQKKKIPSTKNFMSPTISASSKGVVPVKKILAERNETLGSVSSNTHVQKPSNLDPTTPTLPNLDSSDGSSPRVTPFDELLARVSDWDDDDEQNAPVPSVLSSRQPYDPLTNYLSPRPKFLRYRPNRRREIFLGWEKKLGLDPQKPMEEEGQENERIVPLDPQEPIEEEEELTVDGKSSLDPPSLECSVERESEEINGGENDNDEEEEEEEEEEEIEEDEGKGSWGLRGVLKIFILITVLIYSSSYMSSMKSPETSAASGAVQNYAYEAASVGIGNLGQNGEEELGSSVEFAVRDLYEGVGEEEMVQIEKQESVEKSDGLGDAENVEEVKDLKMEKPGEVHGVEIESEFEASQDHQTSLDNCGGEKIEIEREAAESTRPIEPSDGEWEVVSDHEMERAVEVSNQMAENLELFQAIETESEFEAVQDHQTSLDNFEGGKIEIEREAAESTELIEPRDGEWEVVSDHEMERPVEVSSQMAENLEYLEAIETAANSDSFQDHQTSNSHSGDHLAALIHHGVMNSGSTSNDQNEEVENFMEPPLDEGDAEELGTVEEHITDKRDKELGLGNEDTIFNDFDSKPKPDLREQASMKRDRTESNSIDLPKVSLHLAVLSVVLGVCFHLWRTARHSSPNAKSNSETVMGEKSISAPATDESIERIHSVSNSTSFMDSDSDDIRDTESRAPIVELLGEFVVQEMSSSLRSCGMKGRKVERGEESIVSVSQQKSSRIKARSDQAPAQMHQSPSGFSSMDSPSYGSFTTHRVILRKEEGEDGEAVRVITTPLRRSSRIRHRVISP